MLLPTSTLFESGPLDLQRGRRFLAYACLAVVISVPDYYGMQGCWD